MSKKWFKNGPKWPNKVSEKYHKNDKIGPKFVQ